jgi:hypothetical protein
MRPSDPLGKANPNAPAELSRFAFLIGNWRCVAKARLPSGKWKSFTASWLGRYILDGYAIADEYRMADSSGELIVLGMNFRVYDATRKMWNIKWLHALSGAWVDLGPESLGGVRFEGRSILYSFREPMAGHALTRATYTSVSRTCFTWKGEQSDDGQDWTDFMVLEARRTK